MKLKKNNVNKEGEGGPKSQKIVGLSKHLRVLSPPYLDILNLECSIHFFRGPWIETQSERGDP